jgi:DNA helicase-2/ATP-dependent DNA helicase PcrA
MREFVLSQPEGKPLNINYEAELNDEQYKVVSEGDGPCLVLAGAGSGKTRAVTYRVAWLLEHGVPPDRILLLTFTNKAAKEMVTRAETLLKSYPKGLWAGTFHSVANRLLRMYGDRTPFGKNFSILDEDDASDLMKLCIKERKVKITGERFPSANVMKNIMSYSVNARLPIAQILEDRHPALISYTQDILEIGKKYAAEKERQQTMDFDDLLVKLLELLKTDDDLRRSLASKFAYVMVDEFQDTNVIQAELVDLLSSEHRNLLVVGDDAQSIYSFRAAQIKNILEFPERYEGAKTFRLLTNYRSTPEILAVANAVIKNNADQFKKDLTAVVRSGDLPMLVPAADERQEAQYVTEQILQLIDGGTDLKQIAVLFRAAFHSQALEFELMKRNIPYEYRGGLKFFERAHIKDAIAHLRIIRNVKDGMAWMRALQLQPGFGLATAGKAADYFGQMPDVGAALTSLPPFTPKVQLGWRKTAEILSGMLAGYSPAEMLRNFASSEVYNDYLASEYPNARERRDDLEQFSLFAEQYTEINPFLDAIALTGDFGVRVDDTNQEKAADDVPADRLILSTIHQAKGLEWDNVFIIHLAEGAFPSQRAYGEEGGMAEERRLFYVAATRARQHLYFTYPITSGYENVEIRQPSQFIKEIPKDAVEEVRLRAALPAWSSPSYGNGGGYQGSYGRKPSSPRTSYSDGFEEPTIVLDNSGDRVSKPMPGSFLRDIDDL